MVMLLIASLTDDSDKAFMMNLYRDYSGLVRKTIRVYLTRARRNAQKLLVREAGGWA